MSVMHKEILRAGQNCWRIEQAERLAFLVDGDAYFQALRAAIMQAQRSVFILCWDIDTRVRMIREGRSDGLPAEFGAFLHAVLARRRDLQIYVLVWDFHMIYAFEREWWPFPLRLGARRRLHLQMDDGHPVWACHHQKLVVVDDALALVGGLDPTKNRWDTPEHRADDQRRCDPDVGAYPPFHDVQMMVTGPVAAALGELARDRWKRANRRVIPPPVSPTHDRRGTPDLWPSQIAPDLEGVPVAIARTQPQYNGYQEIREVERVVLDSIRAARRHLYIESQYLTSKSVGDALVARLQEPDGPEIALIVHPNSTGWLEQHTMDVLRARLLKQIRGADRHQRLGIYCPVVPGLAGNCMTMHSKLMIVDDEFVRVGSANLSNRSMGLDTECDLVLEAGGNARVQQAIATLRHRLLGEHLGVDPAKVAEIQGRAGSLLTTIERLRGTGRTLEVFDHDIPSEVDAWVPDTSVIDPDRPLDSEVVAAQLVPGNQRTPARRRILMGVGLLAALVALAAAWQWTPLKDWLNVQDLVATLSGFKESPVAPLIVLGGYVIGGLVVMPVTVLIAVTVLAFGPFLGFTYSFAGTLLSAGVTFFVGHLLGSQWVRRLGGSTLNRLSHRLAKQGILSVMAVRIVPVAPFTVVNLVAGASHIRFRDFMIGTAVGMLPGLLGMTVFMDRLVETVKHPGPRGIAIMVLVVAMIFVSALGLRRWLYRRTTRDDRPPPGTP
jgi:phospholipase D1/2